MSHSLAKQERGPVISPPPHPVTQIVPDNADLAPAKTCADTKSLREEPETALKSMPQGLPRTSIPTKDLRFRATPDQLHQSAKWARMCLKT